MDSAGGWLWLTVVALGPIVLAALIIYGIVMWRRRAQNPAAERVTEEATRQVYNKER